MAADSIDIAEPGSPTAALATQSFTRAAATVHREEVSLGNGTGDAAIAEVLNVAPSAEYGLVTRNIPSGTQTVADGGGALTVDALDLDIRNLTPATDVIRIGDGVDEVNVTAAGELNVLATAQPGVDIGDVTVNNAAGAAAVNVQDGGNSLTIDGTVTANVSDNAARDNGKIDVASLDQYTPVSGRLPVDGSGVTQPVSGNVGLAPATSGGLTTFHLASAGTTNATVVKASAGQLFGWYIYNSNAAARKVAFHNSASSPTAGAGIFLTVVIPAGSGANVEFTNGIAFSAGIGITTVTGLADSDSAAVAANDLIINLFYK